MSVSADQVPLSMVLRPNVVTALARWCGVRWEEMTAANVIGMTEADLYDIRGIGVRSVAEIKAALTQHGLALHPREETDYEYPVWSGERLRLKRFGRWVADHPGQTVETNLHDFLVDEARRR